MQSRSDEEFQRCLRGDQLWGDDFTPAELAEWFAEERHAYAHLANPGDQREPDYSYGAVNWRHGFRHLPPGRRWKRVLSFGGASGGELEPVLGSSDEITVVEPSEELARPERGGVPLRHAVPNASGRLEMPDAHFDLVLCFGVLHHIANVSFVVSELSRVLARGGYMILREPITSMGDWRKPRPGLTPRERGIPIAIFDRILANGVLHVRYRRLCMNELIYRLQALVRRPLFASRAAVLLDHLVSAAFSWNTPYHTASRARRLTRNTSAFFVLEKVV